MTADNTIRTEGVRILGSSANAMSEEQIWGEMTGRSADDFRDEGEGMSDVAPSALRVSPVAESGTLRAEESSEHGISGSAASSAVDLETHIRTSMERRSADE